VIDLSPLIERIGHRFSDEVLLGRALTHRSVGGDNNERLEFLGDAVLSLVISEELYRRFPKAAEGQLSRLRASLVKGDTLASLARSLSLGELIELGSGELKSGGHRRASILADALEAVIGALYLDGGLPAARGWVLDLFDERLAQCDPDAVLKDPKTRLQEWLQAQGRPLPAYHVERIEGEAHAQTFVVQCEVTGLRQPTRGVAGSRRKAEQEAARQALELLV